MNIKITSKDGATLKTANKYVEEDIAIVLDESFAQPSGTLEVTENGTHDVTNYESVNVNVASSGEDMLQARVDATNSCQYLLYNYTGSNVDFISDLDTSNVTDMGKMFYGCTKITTVPQLNTSNVTNMYQMFYTCNALTSVPQLDTSKVTNMYQMFYACRELTTIPQLDTSNVTDMTNMFTHCKKLTSIPQLNTSNVTTINGMFSTCNALTSVPQLDTSNVTTMSYMFYDCQSLTSIPQLDTSNVTTMSYTFAQCYKLTTIDISYYNISSTANSSSFAFGCFALKSLIIREFGTNYVLNSNAFASSGGIANGTGYIYVPRVMVDTLKSATNWSTYANQIRALEDYTIDGTTTGALDESKI